MRSQCIPPPGGFVTVVLGSNPPPRVEPKKVVWMVFLALQCRETKVKCKNSSFCGYHPANCGRKWIPLGGRHPSDTARKKIMVGMSSVMTTLASIWGPFLLGQFQLPLLIHPASRGVATRTAVVLGQSASNSRTVLGQIVEKTAKHQPKRLKYSTQYPPKRPKITFQYISRPSKARQYSISIPLGPQHPKIVRKYGKHQLGKGSVDLKFHPNTLQNDSKFQDPPKRSNIQSQHPFRPQHPKIGQKIRKHQLRKGSVQNFLNAPPS